MKVRIFQDDWYCYGIQTEAYLKVMYGEEFYPADEVVEVPKELVDEYTDLVEKFAAWQNKIKKYDT